MRQNIRDISERIAALRWNVIGPVALLVLALLSVAWFDLTTGGDAAPPPLIGAIGTPQRGVFVRPTATPVGARPTAQPRPTVAGTVSGTPATRDLQRRNDLLILFDALNQWERERGEYPFTSGNIQSLCGFKEIDVGCKLREILGSETPVDPLGDPVNNGYWYASDGRTFVLYASLEEDVPDEQECPTDNVDLRKKPDLICLRGP